MQVTVIGGGAVGTLLAEAATATGHDVTVCVRTRVDALAVERDGAIHEVRVGIVAEPVGPVADVVFVAVKATSLASTAPYLAARCGPKTLTVLAQNGLDHVARIAPHLPAGAGPSTGALAYLAAEARRPGLVRHTYGSLLVVDSTHADLVAAAVRGGLRVRSSEDMVTESWRKLLANLVANPITAIAGRRVDVAGPGLGELSLRILEEAATVARAEGAQLDDDEVARVLEGLGRLGVTGSSMLYDRRAGRPMEHHHLTGEVVRRAAHHGLPVPANATLLALLDALEERDQAEE